jgi:peptide/nickel transport system permease protein
MTNVVHSTVLGIWNFSRRNRIATLAAVLLIVIAGLAIAAPVVAPYGYAEQDIMNRLGPPDAEHWLGTDNYGRDILSRIIWGARISMTVGAGATFLGLVVGGALGILGGYRGGFIDLAVTRIIEVLLAFPSFVLCLLVVGLLGPGVPNLISAIAVSLVPKFARAARTGALAIANKEFVKAARTLGAGHVRIMARHIAPNIIGDLAVLSSLWTAHAMLVEASLSFLGLGASPPVPTFGSIMMEGMNVLHEAPWLSLFPGIVIFTIVLLLNIVGDSLRDLADPRMRDV